MAAIDGCSVRGVPAEDFVDVLGFPWISHGCLSKTALEP
ncbi:Uncharacterized protein ToN1_20920 [Aromatoleum petrolei]|nr:Uncharacterized protein ToN1_20920 [Aromatoleum petrolei]